MRRFLGMALLLTTGAATAAPAPLALDEQVISVPGFADFLAVDGQFVWTTNKGRVEQWSRQARIAEVAMPHPCGGMAVANGSLWVADCDARRVTRIDLGMQQTTAFINTGIANPAGETNVVAGAGSIWVPSDDAGVIARIDPATNKVVASIKVDPGTWYMAFGFGALWAVSSKTQSIQRIDPSTNAVTKKTALGKQPGFLAAGEGGVWVQEQGDGTVARIDPRSGAVTGRVKVGETLLYGDIDTGGGRVWLRTTADQAFVAIDPRSLKILGRFGKAAGSGALRYAGTGIWTSAHDVHTLSWWSAAAKAGK